jgi:hypothetical protein
MDGTIPPGSAAHGAPRVGAPSAANVFLGDARLAIAVMNECRHLALARVLGVPRTDANLLTFVLALAAAESALAATRRVVQGPFPLSGADAAMGGVLLHEAVFGIAGPAARKVPFAGALLTVAMLGAVAPALRRTARGIRAAELRVRRQRMSVYAGA